MKNGNFLTQSIGKNAYLQLNETSLHADLGSSDWKKYVQLEIVILSNLRKFAIRLFQSAKDVGGFAVMFFIVFFAFAALGYLLFGSQVGSRISSLESTIGKL